MSDRISAAASFRTGPPSPSSPAAGSLKESHRLPVSSEHIPQTPTSPPLMSVSDQSHVSNFASSQTSANQVTGHPQNLSSPLSSTPMSTQVSQQPTMSVTNSFPTPASSVSGQPVTSTSIDDADHGSKSFGAGQQAPTGNEGAVSHQQAAEYRRTDHDRHPGATEPETGVRDFAISDTQRATDVDAMDVDKDPVSRPSFNTFGSDSLQKDFTSPFHLCKSSPVPTGPDPSLDLISLYELGPVAKSVARIDPVTGEKINRLRKSYEGKLKGFGLAGRNKPVKQDRGAPGSLRHMTMWPEEEWQNQKVFGKAIKVADMDSALHNLQTRAMQMEPGAVPNNELWEDILGHEKPSKHPVSGDTAKKAAPTLAAGRPSTQLNGAPAPQQEPERIRPSRGRKRHYDENSFVGYGEGYADDDDDGGFYSSGEGTGKKKRKKDHVTKVSTPLSERSGSYGVGMFGIGAR